MLSGTLEPVWNVLHRYGDSRHWRDDDTTPDRRGPFQYAFPVLTDERECGVLQSGRVLNVDRENDA